MKRIIIAGFGQPIINLYHCLKDRFEVLGVIPDYERRMKFPFFYDFLDAENLAIISFEDLKTLNPDSVVVMNYNKIIEAENNDVPILNIHMGLLPVYRGNNANSWSILNNDRNVGYTLHEVSSVLDGGKIYYKFAYEIGENETYFHAKEAMNKDLEATLPGVIEEIIDGTLQGKDQSNEKFIYAAKLIPEDGVIKDWNFKTQEIINRNMIFSRPLGTGLKMTFNNKVIEITKLSTINNFLKSKGVVGAVVFKNNEGSVWVKTKDTAISIDELMVDGKITRPADLFKIGDRL